MDINENCPSENSANDNSSLVNETSVLTTAAETNFNEDDSHSFAGPSTNEVKRKRKSSSEELCSKLLKTESSFDLNNLLFDEIPESESNVASESTAHQQDSSSEMGGTANCDHVEEDAFIIEIMDKDCEKKAASNSNQVDFKRVRKVDLKISGLQPSKENVSSSNSSSSSSSGPESVSSDSDADTMLSDHVDENEVNNSDSPDSDDDGEDNDFDVISWNLGLQVPYDEDSASSSDEQKVGKTPKVLQKTLPVEKFSFLKALSERQIKGDDPRRRRLQRFESKVYSSRRMVQHLELYRSLMKHTGCVNCVSFNHSGEILISASDDKHVCLWDWSRSKSLLFFDSGHLANVFQAKFLPFSNDTKLITCGQDCQIRMSVLDQCGLHNSGLIIKHDRTVHKIALQPQMPNTFLSAGEDGIVYSIDIREPNPVCSKLLKMPAGHRANGSINLYSIHCNPLKNYEFVVCGNDKDIRLFDQRKICQENAPPVMTFCPTRLLVKDCTLPRKYSRSVTCAMFSYNGSEILSSYNDNDIYLFDAITGKEVHHYDGHRNFATIKGVNFYGPRSEYIVSGSDCGYVYIWDKDSEAIAQWVKGDDNIVNCLEPHPSFPVLATSGLDNDVKIWMPTAKKASKIREMKEFSKVTRKNHFYKVNNFARFPGRSLVVPVIIDPENVAFPEARSRLPVIVRYRRTLRALLQRRNQPARSSSDDDTPSDRDCDLLF